MLHLILGDSGSGKTEACIRQIREALSKGKRAFLLVPEQETVSAETALWSTLAPGAALSFEVTNFTRLANTVFRREGGLSCRYATKDTKALLMFDALSRLAPYLKDGKKCPDGAVVRRYLDTLRELHYASVPLSALEEAEKRLSDGPLSEKLRDLILVGSFYTEQLHLRYADSERDLDELAKRLENSDFFADSVLCLDSFSSFTGQQFRVLRQVLRKCDVTVTLSLPSDAEDLICFDELIDTQIRLKKMAKEMGVPFITTDLGENKRQKNAALTYVYRRLWRVDCARMQPFSGACDEPMLSVSVQDPFEGAGYIASDISRLVQQGVLYGECAIACADASTYAGILDAELARYGIPCFLSVRSAIASYEPMKLISAAYAVLCGGFDRSDVISFLKCSFGTVPADECDEFELYCETWDLNGTDFTSNEPWDMNPKGIGCRKTPYDEMVIFRVEATRQKLLRSLSPLLATRDKETVGEHCRALYAFLTENCVPQQLKKRSETLLKCGERASAADYDRLWQLICDTLDRMHDTLSSKSADMRSFAEMLSLAFAQADMGRIPTSQDEVLIGSASTMRTRGVKFLYLYGVCEGEFPSQAQGNGLFEDSERKRLRESGIALPPTEERAMTGGLYAFYRMLALPERRVCAVTFRFDCGRKECRPSPVLSEMKRLGGQAFRSVDSRSLLPDAFLWHPEAGLQRIGQLLGTEEGESLRSIFARSEAYCRRANAAMLPLLNDRCHMKQTTAAFVSGPEMVLSQSRIDSFAHCPFSYYGQYVLSLHAPRRAEPETNDIGSMVHFLLERFLVEYKKNPGQFSTQTSRFLFAKAESDTYIRKLLPEHKRFSTQVRVSLSKLIESAALIMETLYEEMQAGNFEPVFFELPVGYDRPDSAESAKYLLPDGTRISLRGFVDRVDAYRKDGDIYLRVVDYKTGEKVFRESDLKDGVNLQLLLYLSSLLSAQGNFRERLGISKDGRVLPAGVMYFSCLPSYLTLPSGQDEAFVRDAMKKKMRRSGVFLMDKEILEAMDNGLSGRFIPIKTKTDGDYDKNSLGALKTSAEWQALFTSLSKTVKRLAQEMRSGNVEAKPLQNGHGRATCDYCDFRPMCRNAYTIGKDEEV